MTLRLDSGSFFGAQRDQRRFGPLTVTLSSYDEGECLPEHSHEHALFCCVLEGAHSDRVGRREHERDHHSIVWYPEGSVHSERHHAPGRHLHVELDHHFLTRVDSEARVSGEVIDLRSSSAGGLAHRLHAEFRRTDDVTPLVFEGAVLELIAHSVREEHKRVAPHWIQDVDDLLREDVRRPPTLAELSDAVGVERSKLTSHYRRHRGHSVGQEIRRLRIELSLRALADSRHTLAEIADRVGFSDQAHFTRTFRKVVGTTPGEYRRVIGIRPPS